MDSRISLQSACSPFATLPYANACALLLENRLQFNAQQARLRFDAYDLALRCAGMKKRCKPCCNAPCP